MGERLSSRERVRRALAHATTDRPPVDLGSTLVSGIQAGAYAKLKKAIGIGTGEVKVYDPFQMLAEVEDDVKRALGVDTCGIQLPVNLYGYRNEDWKPFRLFDGTEVLMPGDFQYDVLDNGDIVQYPQGNRAVPPSGRMPKDGYYFDVIVRQASLEEDRLDAKRWVEQTCSQYTEADLRYLEDTSRHYFENTDYSLVGNFWGAGFGDIAVVPGPHVLQPEGVRDPEEWYVSMITRSGYIRDIFGYQCDLGMKNLKLYREAVGGRIDVITMSGTDFGSQGGPFISPDVYREMFKPLHSRMNKWVHENTGWKTFFHTCGSIGAFLEEFAEAGIDILNPVQVSAKGMEPEKLKADYGDTFVFWGGAVNPQKTLPFGSPGEVAEEARRNIRIFSEEGGYVMANVHNIQINVPTENILALYKSVLY